MHDNSSSLGSTAFQILWNQPRLKLFGSTPLLKQLANAFALPLLVNCFVICVHLKVALVWWCPNHAYTQSLQSVFVYQPGFTKQIQKQYWSQAKGPIEPTALSEATMTKHFVVWPARCQMQGLPLPLPISTEFHAEGCPPCNHLEWLCFVFRHVESNQPSPSDHVRYTQEYFPNGQT